MQKDLVEVEKVKSKETIPKKRSAKTGRKLTSPGEKLNKNTPRREVSKVNDETKEPEGHLGKKKKPNQSPVWFRQL